jgi:hypothetical protein
MRGTWYLLAWRQIELLAHAAPETGSCGRGNGNTSLLLLLHPVHHGSAVMHFSDLVRDTGIEQDPFRRGGLAGIDMGHDAYVSIPRYRCRASHRYILWVRCQ